MIIQSVGVNVAPFDRNSLLKMIPMICVYEDLTFQPVQYWLIDELFVQQLLCQ
jgi:hypothetical protein